MCTHCSQPLGAAPHTHCTEMLPLMLPMQRVLVGAGLGTRVNALHRARCCRQVPVRSFSSETAQYQESDVESRADAIRGRLSGTSSFVQGASRGLGAEYVKQLLDLPDTRVIATCRRPEQSHALQHLQAQHGPERLQLLTLDATDEASIEAAAEQVAQQHSHLDLVINSAGLLHIPGVMTPETAVGRLEGKNMLLAMQTNAIGPLLVCKALLPLLVAAQKHNARGGATDAQPAVIANMSARVGSINDNRLGGWYSYRSSKAALNMLTKTLALELFRKKHKVAAILLHPGTCDTDLSAPFQRNVAPEKLFTRERAVQQLLGIIARTTMAENGSYLAWDGQQIPW